MNWNDSFVWLFGGGTILAVILSILASIICTVVPVAGVIWFILSRRKKASKMLSDASTWVTTRGKIIKSRVEVSGGEITSVFPRIVYEFTVNSQTYQGQQIQAGEQFWASRTSEAAYDLVDQYPVGSEVTIFYDPVNPANCALQR